MLGPELTRPTGATTTGSRLALAASAAFHALVLALAVWLSQRTPPPEPAQPEPATEEPARQVEMVYLPPPPPPPRPPPPVEPTPPAPPPPPAVAPPPAQTQPEPEPAANAPPEATRSEGEEPDEDEPRGSSSPAPRPAPAPVTAIESEARRIFGRPRLGTRPGVGPRAVRPLEAYRPDDPTKCTPTPVAPRDSAGPIEYGTVMGRIFRQDNGQPLAGAHLQMLGTPYVTFTDGQGEYRFRFDLSLVDNCRTQYVRVSAGGYESRLLVLVVGRAVRSEDVHLRRR